MKINWPEELVHSVGCRRCVVFFGAGVSMNSVGKDGKTRTPTWGEFLKTATKSLGSPKKAVVKEVFKLVDSRDYLTAAEVIRNEIGQDEFTNILKKCFHVPDFQPAEIHDLLFKLDLRICITPNVDNIYETAVGKHGAGAVTVKSYEDDDIADALRRHERVLIKSHGSISKPSRVIFTRSDYAEARNRHADFYELINALIRTHTMLFVGCGLDDPDIRSLLEDYRYRHPHGQCHYFLTQASTVSKQLRQVLEDSMKIKLIEYPEAPGHANLTLYMKALVEQVDAKRNNLAGTQTW